MKLVRALVAVSLLAVSALPQAQPQPAAPPSAAPVAQQIPLRDFFRNVEQTAHQVSPDGRFVSWVAPYERRQNVHVRPLSGGDAVRITSETARDIAGYFWKSDRILYVKDFGGDENFHVVSVDPKGGDLKDLTPGEKVRASIIDDLYDDPDHVIISHNRRDARVFDVFRVNVRTGEEKLIAQNPGNITGWRTDHAGRLRVAVTTDGVNNTLLYRDKEDEQFRPLLTTNFKETVQPLFFTFDNTALYVSSNRGRDKSAIFVFDPKTATEGRLIFDHPDVDVSQLAYSRKRKVLTAVRFTTWKVERKVLDAQTQAMLRDLESKLPGYEIDLTSVDREERRYTIATSSDRTRGKRYLYDRETKQLTLLADVSPWLPETELAEMKPVVYKSRDGLTIHGYLTVPKGVTAKNLPVVVNPHGGPWARDNWRFNSEVQFLASRGYAVFQPNFRGSTGYGRKFWEASFKQWGLAMQDDVTDGVRWLVEQGIADPKRVAIYGASYGGYATLSGITTTPDLYAAAVDYVGVSNLMTFMGTIPPYWKPYLEMLHEMVGHTEKDRAALEATSPVNNVHKIKTPLFIAQGAKDPRVVKAESDQMVEALKKRGVEVQYMVKDNEGHGFSNEENRFEFYEAMDRFLAQHLKR